MFVTELSCGGTNYLSPKLECRMCQLFLVDLGKDGIATFQLGAKGVFLWELAGRTHRDEFYAMNLNQIIDIFPR